jgi:hypothetical protein
MKKFMRNILLEGLDRNKNNMKNHLNGFLLGITISMLIAFKAADFVPKESTAEVNKVEGLYIFTDSKPVMPYDSIGTVELGFVSGTQYESIKANLIKRARKKYPNADGLILNLKKKGLDNCSVIKFK